MENFDDFVERVREGNPIEDVIRESGVLLKGHGKILIGSKHDSLKVRVDWQRAFWYSMNWNGDVFSWVMREKNVEFMDALEILARRANLDMPKLSAVNDGEVVKQRATADVFSVAATVFQRWLVGDNEKRLAVSDQPLTGDQEALEYCIQGRGWTLETIKASSTGFSGRGAEWQIKDMKGELALWGMDATSPAAVAVLGFEGDVDAWARSKGLRDHPDFDPTWIEWKKIYGLMDTPGLIYAHRFSGNVRYLSRRNLPSHANKTKSFNPQKVLATRQPYFNFIHQMGKGIVLCEGQGDAITWGQWGFGAMAFCGLLGDLETMEERQREQLMKLAVFINKHPSVYVALDEDDAGQKALPKVATLLGPKIQVVRMSRTVSREDVEREEIKNGDGDSPSPQPSPAGRGDMSI